jgi:dynein heavy chain 2, cytosolic
MKKLFAAIHSVGFSGDNKQIIEIFSIEKERVPLQQRVQLTENVEDWLTALEKSMFVTLENSLKEYISSGTKDIKINDYPSQILCLMEEIRFSTELESAVRGKGLPALDSKLRHDLLSLTKLLPTVGKL